jgi:hypothetical protein
MREASRFPFPLFVLFLLAATAPARAQMTAPADPADVSSIDGILNAFYEVVSGAPGVPRQWDRDATLYWPGTVFTILNESPDGPTFHNVTPAEFARESDRFLVESGFSEREIHRETHGFGRIAQVWSTYEWRTADGRTGRGINGLQLLQDGGRWWITHATWENETEDRAIPADYLPDE